MLREFLAGLVALENGRVAPMVRLSTLHLTWRVCLSTWFAAASQGTLGLSRVLPVARVVVSCYSVFSRKILIKMLLPYSGSGALVA